MLLTLRGTPFMYYGEEIGLRDIPIRKKEDVKDSIGKRFWPLNKGRDGCRAPMQWTEDKNAGFSEVDPWLPVNDNYTTRNVAQQVSDPQSMLNFFKKIVAIRKSSPALQRGDFTPLTEDPHQVLAYQRQLEDDRVIVVLNFSIREAEFDLPEGSWQSLLDDSAAAETLKLAPYQVSILKAVD
jgi:alpha-glucosidase